MSGKILVPHDGYEMSEKALKYAIEIAKAMRMEIIILRVVSPVISDTTLYSFLSDKERRRVRRELTHVDKQVQSKIYDNLAKQLTACMSKNVKASRLVVIGDPVEKILSVTQKENPYMLIIGSRRLKGFGKLKILGSVARKVSENARCPVTIVH